jgi:hypothetical protein
MCQYVQQAARLEDDSLLALEDELVAYNEALGRQKNVWNLCRETLLHRGSQLSVLWPHLTDSHHTDIPT